MDDKQQQITCRFAWVFGTIMFVVLAFTGSACDKNMQAEHTVRAQIEAETQRVLYQELGEGR